MDYPEFSRPSWVLLFLFLVMGMSCKTASKPWIHAEGIEKFWEIHDVLQQDQEPSDEMWEALFTSPGYLQLDLVERRSRWMKPVFRKAYRPSFAPEAAKLRASKDFIGTMLLPHLEMVGSNRGAVDDFVAEFSSDETLELALSLVKDFLPEGAVRPDLLPPVYLVIMDGDSKALSNGIVMDAYGISFWSVPATVLSHEMHHLFRERIKRVRKADVAPEERELFTVLEQLEEEGVAEMIDKTDWIESDDFDPSPHPLVLWVQERYRRSLEEVPEAIRELDRGLAAVSQDARVCEAQGIRLADLIPSFDRHTIGLFMARTIEGAFGRERLISVVGNPLAFVRLYAEVARTNPGRATPLSDEAIDLLLAWEEKYVD